jgi:feruloyl esterase
MARKESSMNHRLIAGSLGLLCAAMASPLAAQQSCENLSALKLQDTTITLAQPVAPGEFVPPLANPGGGGALPGAGPAGAGRGPVGDGANATPGAVAGRGPDAGAQTVARGGRAGGPGAAYKNLPMFCRVAAEIRPTADSDIKIEVWMPASAGWNGKLQATGNGGWSGAIGYAAMGQALARGYATTGTNTGHDGGSGSFALGHPEKLIDFGSRAVHLMTVQAKAIIAAYYGRGPTLSYWNACSTGGRQGLREAQEFPADYDGIIAGAPANYMTHLEAWTLWAPAAMNATPESAIPTAKFATIHQAVLVECDVLDGVKDGVIEDPRLCHFDPKTLLCKGGDSNDCLTAAQVATAQKIYLPATNPRTKEMIFPPFEPGSETGWGFFAGPNPPSVATDLFKYETFKDENWDWHTFDFDKDVALADKVDGGILNTLDPNLKPFFAHGGKLIQYHGWADSLIAPGNSINYYESVAAKLGGAKTIDEDYRLFMVPGMGHCAGGDAATNFDMVTAMEQWREQKKAPAQVVATKYVQPNNPASGVAMTHPLCPYPQTAHYTGAGDTNDAANYACVAAKK